VPVYGTRGWVTAVVQVLLRCRTVPALLVHSDWVAPAAAPDDPTGAVSRL
jgi:hypothetical protein